MANHNKGLNNNKLISRNFHIKILVFVRVISKHRCKLLEAEVVTSEEPKVLKVADEAKIMEQ
jgi:hypothetical protein